MKIQIENLAEFCGLLLANVALAACGGTSASPAVSGQAPLQTNLTAKPWIYVTNGVYGSPSITVYGRRANGDAVPVRTIAGSNTELRWPMGIAVDRRGKIYVANVFGGGTSGYGSILIFAPDANGNVAPVATIEEGLNYPFGVALDSSGNVYVANNQGESVTIYAAKTYKPIGRIYGDNTQLYPVGLTLDSSGQLYVVNSNPSGSGRGWITVYSPGANGNVKPIRQISGHRTGLWNPLGGIGLDGSGDLYVTGDGYRKPKAILVYRAGARGDAKPIRRIAGSKTQLDGVDGLALDARARVYVTTTSPLSGPTAVLVFAPNADRNVAPIREIEGPQTGLAASQGVFVR